MILFSDECGPDEIECFLGRCVLAPMCTDEELCLENIRNSTEADMCKLYLLSYHELLPYKLICVRA